MKNVLLILFALNTLTVSCQNKNKDKNNSTMTSTPTSLHSFTVKSLDSGEIRFADYAGKMILIVNTASSCGFTPQYKELQELYEKYQNRLVVIGFPCNDFGRQEPGNADEIRSFCSSNYNVTFPMAAKVSISGDNKAPIYEWLTNKSKNGVKDSRVSWNFNKYLIDAEGHLIEHYGSNVSPMDKKITDQIK